MNLPDEKVEQLAEAIWNASRADEGTISATGAKIVAKALQSLLAGWLEYEYDLGIHHGTEEAYQRGLTESEARAEALREAADAVQGAVSYGFELRPDGSEDPTTAVYVEGLRDAWQIVKDRAAAADAEESQ